MGFVQGLNLTALAFILTAQMFRAMNPSLEEAAKIHGMSFVGTVRRITLPLAFPAILAAFIYMLTIGIATFDVPADHRTRQSNLHAQHLCLLESQSAGQRSAAARRHRRFGNRDDSFGRAADLVV